MELCTCLLLESGQTVPLMSCLARSVCAGERNGTNSRSSREGRSQGDDSDSSVGDLRANPGRNCPSLRKEGKPSPCPGQLRNFSAKSLESGYNYNVFSYVVRNNKTVKQKTRVSGCLVTTWWPSMVL